MACAGVLGNDYASPLLKQPLRPVNGHVQISDRPGVGVDWDVEAVARALA